MRLSPAIGAMLERAAEWPRVARAMALLLVLWVACVVGGASRAYGDGAAGVSPAVIDITPVVGGRAESGRGEGGRQGPDMVATALLGAPRDARLVVVIPDGRGVYKRVGATGLFAGLAGAVKGLGTWEAWGALAGRMGWTAEEAAERLLGGGVVVALWDPPGGGGLIDTMGARLGEAPYAVWCRVSEGTQRRVRESLEAEPAAVIDGQPVLRALGGQMLVGVRPVADGASGAGEDARPYWLWLASAGRGDEGAGVGGGGGEGGEGVAGRVRASVGMIGRVAGGVREGGIRADERLVRAIGRVGGAWPDDGGVDLAGRGDVWALVRYGGGVGDERVSVVSATLDSRAVVIHESGYGPATPGARVMEEGAFAQLASGAELAVVDLSQPGRRGVAGIGRAHGAVGGATGGEGGVEGVGGLLAQLMPLVWTPAERDKVEGLEALTVRRTSVDDGDGDPGSGWGVGVGLRVRADGGLVRAVDETMGRVVSTLEGSLWGSVFGVPGVPSGGASGVAGWGVGSGAGVRGAWGGRGAWGVWGLSPHAERRVRLRAGGGVGSVGGTRLSALLGPRPSVAWRVATEGVWTGWVGPDEGSASAGRVGLERALLGGVREVIWDDPGVAAEWAPAERSRGVIAGRLLRGVAGTSAAGRALGGALEWVERVEWRGLVLSATEASSAVWVFVGRGGAGADAAH